MTWLLWASLGAGIVAFGLAIAIVIGKWIKFNNQGEDEDA